MLRTKTIPALLGVAGLLALTGVGGGTATADDGAETFGVVAASAEDSSVVTSVAPPAPPPASPSANLA